MYVSCDQTCNKHYLINYSKDLCMYYMYYTSIQLYLVKKKFFFSNLVESTKSNGYMMPVIKEEKDIENNEHMQTSVNTFGQNIIMNENVEKERETWEQKETEATIHVHDTQTESNGGGMDHTIQGPATSTNDKGPADIDANNPLYIKHHNTTTVSSTEEDDDSDHDYLDVLIPGDNNGTTCTTTEDNTIDHGEEDYENFSSIKLAEALNRQGKHIANVPSPPPRSPTISGAAAMKSNRTPSNASKHDQIITQLTNNLTSAATPPMSSSSVPKSNRTASNASSKHNQMIANLTSAMPLSPPTNGSSQSTTTTPTYIGKHDPPETRPKPKHKQRNPSNASSHNEPLVSPTDEPHYMPLKSANLATGQFYKELDFSTVDPNNEYVVPRFT